MRGLKLAVCFVWRLSHSFASTNRVWCTGETFYLSYPFFGWTCQRNTWQYFDPASSPNIKQPLIFRADKVLSCCLTLWRSRHSTEHCVKCASEVLQGYHALLKLLFDLESIHPKIPKNPKRTFTYFNKIYSMPQWVAPFLSRKYFQCIAFIALCLTSEFWVP